MQRLFAHPGRSVLLMALVAVGAGHRALFLEQDNSPESFFAADAPARRVYHRLVETFRSDEVVLVQLRGARADRKRDLEAVAQLARDLRGAPGVRGVLSPGGLGLERPQDEAEVTDDRARQIARELEAVDVYRKVGIYRPRVGALGVAAQVVMQGPDARRRLSAALDRISRRLAEAGFTPLVAGLAPANAAIDRESRRSLRFFLPLVVVLALVIGLVLFRSLRAVAAMFLPVAGSVLLGLAGLELAGETLNMITGVMPPLVLAIGFAGAIHLVAHHAACCGEGSTPLEAARRTIRDKVVPTVFAFGTTAVGFGSLAISEVHSVRVMGLTTAGALLAAAALVTLGTPSLLLLFRPRLAAPPHRRRLLEQAARFSIRRRWVVIAVTLVVSAGVLAGVGRVRTAVDGMELLPPKAPERIAFRQLEREGVGLGNVDIWIQTKVPDEAALLRLAPRLAAMATAVEKAPLVSGVVGAHDLLRVVGYRMTGRPELPASLTGLNLLMDRSHRRELRRQLRTFWHPTRGLKLTLLSRTGTGRTLATQRRLALAAAARTFPGAPVEVSGHFAMLIGTPEALMQTLGQSLALTTVVVATLLLLFFRSIWLALCGMLANLLPVALVLGAMGWLEVRVDVATVMTASVAFGVAVDDTFHYLYHRRRSGSTIRAAHVAGQGIVATSLVIAGGFLVLALSGFGPVVRFGALTSSAVAVALLVDAVLLPALLGRRPAAPEKERSTCTA